MSLIAYYRVSTQRQGESGLGLEAQQHTVREYAARSGRALAAEFTEVESGRKCNRPVLAQAVALVRATEGAALVVAKLDRLARDARFLLELANSGIALRFLDFPDLDTESSIGRMIVTIMASVAEFESRRIGDRCREAAARRKARKAESGAPPAPSPFSKTHQRAARRARADQQRARRAALYPLVLGLRQGRTLAQTAEALNARGVPTPLHRQWTAGLVWAVLKSGESV